jgi:hypothetical protein
MLVDTNDLKSQVDLLQIVSRELGPPVYNRQAYAQWSCPFHDDGKSPSLTVYTAPDAGWYCFGCEAGYDVIDFVQAYYKVDFKDAIRILESGLRALSPGQAQYLKDTRRKRADEAQYLARLKREKAARLLAEAEELECWSHDLLEDSRALGFLADKGVSQGIACYFDLGLHKTHYLGPCISIPWRVGGQLRAIQYRAIAGEDRYRWEPGGTPTIFNGDTVKAGQGPLLIVEGAIKSMVMTQAGFDTCAIATKGGWSHTWAKAFQQRPIYVLLDPDANEQSAAIAHSIGPNAHSVKLPAKIDDLIVRYGWPAERIKALMNTSVS